jgi:hypothetical protein
MVQRFIKYYLLFVFLIGVSFQAKSQEGKTQNVNNFGINMNFVTDRSKIKSNELASNVLRITNNTKKELTLTVQINQPAGWKMFGPQTQSITIKANDSAFIPVRVRPLYDIKGNTNYIVNAFLSSDQFTISNSIWYIAVDKQSNWSVFTPETKVYFSGDSDTTQFEISITNSGNSDEALVLQLTPEKEIDIVNSDKPIRNQMSFPIFLKVGKDTTLRFYAWLKKEAQLPINAAEESMSYETSKLYKVKIQVRNERVSNQGSTKLWTGNIDFMDLPNKTKLNESSVESIPMTFEFNTFDALTQSTFSSLNIYGSKKYENNSTLTYYYQADFVKNQMDLKSYLGNYVFLSYYHKRFSFELGDIGSNRPGSSLNGKGIKAALNLGNHIVGGMFIRKPKLFDLFYAEGFGGFHSYKGKKLYVDNFYQSIENNWSKVAGSFATSDWNFLVARGHLIRFGGGYSLENHSWIPGQTLTTKGYGYKLGYSGNYKKFSLSVNTYGGTKDYSPMKGTFSLTGSARYLINKNYSISASGYRFAYEPNIYTLGQLTNDTLYNVQDNYSLKLNYQKDQNVFIFQPKYYTINSNPIESKTGGLAFEYRRLSRTAFKFYVNMFGGYTYFDRNPELKNIFISFVQASLRYNKIQFNARYYYGPYFTIEQLDYIQTKTNIQKIYSTLFYDYWFMQNKLRLNININYFYNTQHNRNQFITRPELFYYAPGGFRFNIYARYSFFSEGSYIRDSYNAASSNYIEEVVEESRTDRFEIGAGAKFNVNMPTGIKRYYKVKVIAFRDLNGNGVMDPGEKGIENMLIMLTQNDTVSNLQSEENNFNEISKIHELVTNGKGVVEYDNIPVGEYIITAKPLTSMGGWFDGQTFYRTIDKNKEIYIPLSKGARISGGIITERAKYSDNKPLYLGNIRVTAVHTENGKTFSTLTDKDGQFVLFAPNGSYKIMVNDEAVGSKFEFLQNNIPLNISKEFENYNVSFFLVEKERKMKINNGGTQKPQAPIQRNENQNTENNSLDTTDSPIQGANFLSVETIINDSTAFIIKIYSEERGRELAEKFDELKKITAIKSVQTKNGGYIYVSEKYQSRKEAEKALKKVLKLGFTEAEVIPMIIE